MKLVDILARELKVWPEDCDFITQSRLHTEIHNAPHGKTSESHRFSPGIFMHERHEDEGYPVVTRAEWQAAVDALNAPKVVDLEIDWSKQPEGFPLWIEGTTAEHRHHNGWYRDSGQIFEGADGGQCRSVREGQFFTVHRKPEQKIFEWDGVGLPPVGVDCEVENEVLGGWDRAEKILAHSSINGKDVAVFQRGDLIAYARSGSFRPTCTAEQVAAEEREKAAKELFMTINWDSKPRTWENLLQARRDDYRKAIDAGYRKEPKPCGS